MDIHELSARQHAYFLSGATRPAAFRLDALRKLRAAVLRYEPELNAALLADLNKPASEAYFTETGIVLEEIRFHLRHLRGWMRDRTVRTPLAQFWSRSFVSPEPHGVALILSPWNYPVQLCLAPLVGAISAGNCAVVKPSAYAPATSRVLARMLGETFPPEYVAVVEGGREQNTALLDERFDFIFFTGSVTVGKLVMEKAARHLTPVLLELGGKSPVIVDETADLRCAAKRVIFGKLLNAGQTCVAPDYVLVQADVKEAFLRACRAALDEFLPGGDLSDFPRIVNEKHFRRLCGLLQSGTAVTGGGYDEARLQIQPTLLDGVGPDAPVMQEEIFGPILPILTYSRLEDCVDFIRSRPKPLALYLFTRSREAERTVLNGCSFGGGCVNDTVIHLATTRMGFGGVGESGMGSYHGKHSFDAFSHRRSIVRKHVHPDLPMRYRPYTPGKDRVIRRILG